MSSHEKIRPAVKVANAQTSISGLRSKMSVMSQEKSSIIGLITPKKNKQKDVLKTKLFALPEALKREEQVNSPREKEVKFFKDSKLRPGKNVTSLELEYRN